MVFFSESHQISDKTSEKFPETKNQSLWAHLICLRAGLMQFVTKQQTKNMNNNIE